MNASVTDNPNELRYELRVDGHCAGVLRYRRQPGGAMVFVFPDIEPHLEGNGLGTRLVQGALDDARARGLKVVPFCPFVSDFIRRHPEYSDLVTEDTGVPW